MKKLFIGLFFLIPSVAFACPSLEGTWSSSKEKFESFNKKWANVEEKAWSFMSQNQGYETIVFKGNEMRISTPEIKIKVGDRSITLPPKEERMRFNVLGCTDKDIVLQYERYGKAHISKLQFENDNTYWEYMGSSGNDGNSHIREYYTKAK